MTTAAKPILDELAKNGNPGYKATLMKHGAKEPFYGVKVEYLKKIQKRVKKDHELALALYDSGISDAMYLAALICEPAKFKKADLHKWAKKAHWQMLSEYTVAWAAAESPFAAELALEWIDSPKESIASSGWSTYASLVGLKPDEELDLKEIDGLLTRAQKEIHKAANRVKYTMNGFVIAVGGSVIPLADRAKAVAKAIGDVEVNMGDTACKVPNALQYIEKIEKGGKQGKKRKTAMC